MKKLLQFLLVIFVAGFAFTEASRFWPEVSGKASYISERIPEISDITDIADNIDISGITDIVDNINLSDILDFEEWITWLLGDRSAADEEDSAGTAGSDSDSSTSTSRSGSSGSENTAESAQSGQSSESAETESTDTDAIAKAAKELRKQMRARKETIQVEYTSEEDDAEDAMRAVFQKAIEHNGDPDCGDYLKWQFKSYEAQAKGYTDLKTYHYTFTYKMEYYTTAEQEEEFETQIQEVMEKLKLSEESEYRKVLIIHDYITRHVEYDNNEENAMRYTAYGALTDGSAVCQGYATLFYQMALRAGLDARVVAGTANPGDGTTESHAWNIVRVDGQYYNIDCTWDASLHQDRYFLKTDAVFDLNHYRDEDYDTEEFREEYPIASKNY